MNEDWKEHFRSMWNYVDLLTLVLTIVVVTQSFPALSFISVSNLRAFASFASFLLIVKLYDWLRLFENTASYVLLTEETVADIRHFMILVVFSLMMFGVPLVVLDLSRSEATTIVEAPFNMWFVDMMVG